MSDRSRCGAVRPRGAFDRILGGQRPNRHLDVKKRFGRDIAVKKREKAVKKRQVAVKKHEKRENTELQPFGRENGQCQGHMFFKVVSGMTSRWPTNPLRGSCVSDRSRCEVQK